MNDNVPSIEEYKHRLVVIGCVGAASIALACAIGVVVACAEVVVYIIRGEFPPIGVLLLGVVYGAITYTLVKALNLVWKHESREWEEKKKNLREKE